MNILDENVPDGQRRLLRNWRIAVRHIGHDVGRKGMQDDEIIPFLLRLRRVTFFTLDRDFFKRNLCHSRYCLVCVGVEEENVATAVRRLLRHPAFDTQAKRMGMAIRIFPTGLSAWRLHAEKEMRFDWPTDGFAR